MTEKDLEEEDMSGAHNGATFRTLLALRHVLFAPEHKDLIQWQDLRVVVPLSRPSKDIHVFSASVDGGPHSRKVVLVQDLSLFVNSLIWCHPTRSRSAVSPARGDRWGAGPAAVAR